MKHTLVLAALMSLAISMALAQLPGRDLTLELRQIEEGGAGYVVGTQPTATLLAPRQLQARNGARARFSVGQAIPLQWVQSVAAQSVTLAASGVSASSRGGGVAQALTWMQAGQHIAVLPRWSGGKQDVAVEVEVQLAAVQARTGPELLAQQRSHWVTTVSAPRGVYGSEAGNERRRLLQLRVSAP